MEDKQYYCMRYYVTYRCNSRCSYCNVWQDERFRNVKELELHEAKELIRQGYQAGVRYIDFTGGEPVLNQNLSQLVQYAKSLGIKTEITTNGIARLTKNVREAEEYVDKLNISLDTLNPDAYDRIRGVDCLEEALTGMKEILKIRRPRIMTVISQDNVEEMDDMIHFAQDNRMEIYLNPVFAYFASDERKRAEAAEKILSKIYEPYTVVMLHFIEFIKNSNAQYRPLCSANNRTLTFAPDGALMLPCYHALKETIPWDGNLSGMLASKLFAGYRDRKNCGTFCNQCSVVPYFGISFSYCLDQYFLLQSYSEKLNHMKRDFINRIPELGDFGSGLNSQLRELMDIVHSLPINREHKSSLLYWAKREEHGYVTDIYREVLTEQQYLREQRAKDCWQLKLVPHYEFDKVYESVFRSAFAAYESGVFRNEALEIFRDAAEFQLRLWKYYISKNMRVSVTCNFEAEIHWLKEYAGRLRKWEETNGKRYMGGREVACVREN